MIINKADYTAHNENIFFKNKILELTGINLYLQAIHMSDKTNYQSSHIMWVCFWYTLYNVREYFS